LCLAGLPQGPEARAATATLSAPVLLLSAPRTDLGVMTAFRHDEQRRRAARVGAAARPA